MTYARGVIPDYVGVRYDPVRAKHGHVESYFLKANDPASRRAIWLKGTIYAGDTHPRAAVAEAWAIAFDEEKGHVAVKTQVPYEQARFARDALDVSIDGSTWSPRTSRGEVQSGGRAIAWDLSYESLGAPLVHFPRAWMYEAKLPSSKLVSPLPDLRVSGTVVVNGEETWTLDRWPGLLGHNWGRRHAHLYAWGHCNAWDRSADERGRAVGAPDDLVLEGVSARVKVGPVLAPLATLLCLRYRGVRYDLNALSSLATNRGQITPRRWAFSGRSRLCKVSGELWGTTDDFVGLYYANPDGTTCHCLNTKLARARVELTVHGRPPVVLESSAAALEIGTQDPNHGVRMYV